MKKLGEKRLVRKLKHRDPRAFETLVRQYEAPIVNLVYRMIGSREEAEDLAQEVFITVFKKIDCFRGDSSVATWIYRIASNMCKNRKKYLGRRYYDRPTAKEQRDRAPGGMESMRTASDVGRPDELVEGFETERILQEAIGSLDEEQRLVLVLRDIQGLPYEEISEITGLALGTVKSRLHRARMALKEKLKPHLR